MQGNYRIFRLWMAFGGFLLGWIFQWLDGLSLVSALFICAGIGHYCVNEILYYRLFKKTALVKNANLHKAILIAAGASLIFLQVQVVIQSAEFKIQFMVLFALLCFLAAIWKERLIT